MTLEKEQNTSSSRKRIALILVALLSPYALVQVWILTSAPNVAFETMPTCPANSQNCAHLGGGQDFRMDDTMELVVQANISVISELLQTWIQDGNMNVLFETTSAEEGHVVHAVDITPFWRFPDDVMVHLEPTPEGHTRMELHSQSRLGQSDLGVNPERLNELHQVLMAGSPSAA